MKKIIILFSIIFLFYSCGSDFEKLDGLKGKYKDRKFKKISVPKDTLISDISDQKTIIKFAKVNVKIEEDLKFYYIDKNGNIINESSLNLRKFSEDLSFSSFSKEQETCYVDENFKEKFSKIESKKIISGSEFINGFASARLFDNFSVEKLLSSDINFSIINSKAEIVLEADDKYSYNLLGKFFTKYKLETNKFEIIDINGKNVIDGDFVSSITLDSQHAILFENSKDGFLYNFDKKQKTKVPEFDYASDFLSGKILLLDKEQNKVYLLEDKGTISEIPNNSDKKIETVTISNSGYILSYDSSSDFFDFKNNMINSVGANITKIHNIEGFEYFLYSDLEKEEEEQKLLNSKGEVVLEGDIQEFFVSKNNDILILKNDTWHIMEK